MSERAALEAEPVAKKPSARTAGTFVQRRADSSAPSVAAPASVQRTLASPGRPLDAGTRGFMESRFGHDFSNVRVHTDSLAGQSARDIHSHAYTAGDHIAFAPGKYQPESHSGRELLAHELAHTVQQGGLQRRGSDLAVDTEPGSPLEHEADAAAHAAMRGTGAPCIAGRPASPTISRTTDTEEPKTLPKGAVLISTDARKLGPLQHTVTLDGPLPPKSSSARVRKFKADPFHLPGSKGEGADTIYKNYIAANQLRTVIGFNASKQPRSELWEARDRTDVLGDSWLQLMRWPEDEKDVRWKAVTGETAPFPQVAGESAQIDHIVELQLGGTNNPNNLRALDKAPNGESGTSIWVEVSMLAKAVRAEPSFAVGPEDQIQLSFTGLQVKGEVWSGDYTKKPMNALKAHMKALAGRAELKDDATTKYIQLASGANVDTFAVPPDWGVNNKVATLDTFRFNKAPAQLISSLLLTDIKYDTATSIYVGAEFDLRNRTRIPLGTKAAAAASGNKPFNLKGAKGSKDPVFKLTMPAPPSGLSFDYPFLSPVTIQSLKLNESGDLDWKGEIKTSIALLNPIGIEYRQGALLVVKGIDPATLKSKKLLGFQITEADVKLQLAPEFKLEAELKFAVGSGTPPIVQGGVRIEPDGVGIKGTGNIAVNLPKAVKSAKSEITYVGGGGRPDDWKASFSIESNDLKLAPGYSLAGKVDGFIDSSSKELAFSGQFTATLPGENSASLGLRRTTAGGWQLFGGAKFKVPRIPTQLEIKAIYDFGSEKLTATLEQPTPISLLGGKLTGNLKYVKVVITGEGKVIVTGEGGVGIKYGKAKGNVNVALHEGGWFSGDGSVTYQLRENLSLTGGVVFTERPKSGEPSLRVNGELRLDKLHLFDAKGSEKELLKVGATIPIPGLSAGTSGLVINIGGSLMVGYAFGPGAIEPLIFKAGFNPLDDATDFTLEVDGTVKLPASAFVRAAVNAELAAQVDAYIAKGGVAAGLSLSGKIELKGELFATLKALYKDRKLNARVDAGVRAALDLGFALKAYVRAYASSLIGLDAETRIEWVLAQKSLPTGLKLEVSAPFIYDSVDGFTFPELKDINIVRPEIDVEGTVKRLWGRGEGTKTKA